MRNRTVAPKVARKFDRHGTWLLRLANRVYMLRNWEGSSGFELTSWQFGNGTWKVSKRAMMSVYICVVVSQQLVTWSGYELAVVNITKMQKIYSLSASMQTLM